jgi:hypothetical protein
MYSAVGSQLARNWVAPVRATSTVRKRLVVRPIHHVPNHSCWVTPPSQPGGSPCWASSLALGLIGGDAQSQIQKEVISDLKRENLIKRDMEVYMTEL